jgi:ABC-type glycerol-3-phosphate transport system substrate-binding protein
MRNFIFYLLSCISITACGQTDCNKLQANFSSYSEAVSKIKSTKFTLTDNVITLSSSWVRGASYYSCDKKIGYFIIKTVKRNYIYKDLPISIWYNFKNANSFGSYYNRNIKNRYQLYLTN